MNNIIFTITAGRTGTDWLSAFLSENLNKKIFHEFQGAEFSGEDMPDIRTTRNFNELGFNEKVQEFWIRKQKRFDHPNYFGETNHTLCKSGLIEYIVTSKQVHRAKVVVLRRNLARQTASYVKRRDFINNPNMWLWYLHPNYRKNVVPYKYFSSLGELGRALWYAHEMEARQEMYIRDYNGIIDFIPADLEELSSGEGGRSLLERLGYDLNSTINYPAKKNASSGNNDRLVEDISNIMRHLNVNIDEIIAEKSAANFLVY